MAVTITDIKYRLSVPGATEGDDDPQANPDDSLGEYMSTTEVVDATKGNLFSGVTAVQAQAGITRFRCIFMLNTHSTDTAQGVRAYIPSQLPGGGVVSIGLDPAGVIAGDDSSAQAEVIADEETPPDGVTFSAPGSYDVGLEIGDVEPGEAQAIWVRMIVAPNVEAVDEDTVLVECAGVSDG